MRLAEEGRVHPPFWLCTNREQEGVIAAQRSLIRTDFVILAGLQKGAMNGDRWARRKLYEALKAHESELEYPY
jgi:hypothetical protein